MSMCRASYDNVEIEEYQQQTVVDKRIETGQPSLLSLLLLRPLDSANRTFDTCRETPSADFDSMSMADQISSAIVKAQDIQFSSLSNAIYDGLKQFSSNFVNIFKAKYGDEPPQKRARTDVHSDRSSIGRETPRQRSSSSCAMAKSVVVPVIPRTTKMIMKTQEILIILMQLAFMLEMILMNVCQRIIRRTSLMMKKQIRLLKNS